MKNVLIHIKDLHVNYGQHEVLKGVNMEIEDGERICLTGKNGSGKSTLLKSIAGIIPVQSGGIIFENRDIQSLNTQQRIQLGIGYLMQHNSIFPRLKVEDHILLAAQQNKKRSVDEIWRDIDELFPQVAQNRKKIAGLLSGGQGRFLSFAMLVAQGADKLWILDEPSAGIAKSLLTSMGNFLNEYVTAQKITLLVVEQNSNFGNAISTRQLNIENL